jgi:hypothetical protein
MRKRRPNTLAVVVAGILIVGVALTGSAETAELTRAELLDKIRGAWVGKAYGVALGGPTEFKNMGTIIEGTIEMDEEGLKKLPRQDDLFVNMVFLQMVEEHGFDTPAEVFAEAFAWAGFGLGHANSQARQNILAGVPASMSGHPKHSPHAEDIDFQIEADFIGLIHPGLPKTALDLCDRVGHIMNYGDGYYGGVFVAAMYAAAFVQDDPHEIVASGLKALPEDSGYAEIVRDVMRLYKEHPEDWKAAWHELQVKWGHEDKCPWGVTGAHGSLKGMFNISASLNGAYIVLGMLYGNGDFDTTVDISLRAGQDSDCNPSTAAGVLGAMMGFEALPEHAKEAVAPYMDVKFSHTRYSIEIASRAARALRAASRPDRDRFRQPDSDRWLLAHRQPHHLGRRLERALVEGRAPCIRQCGRLHGGQVSRNRGLRRKLGHQGRRDSRGDRRRKADGSTRHVSQDEGRQEAGLERTSQRGLVDRPSRRRAHAEGHGHRRQAP